MEEQRCREKLIAVTLDLCARQGYEATTIDQITTAAGVASGDFSRYFASKDAVIISLVDDVLHATAAALAQVQKDTDPTEALLIATTEVLTAIFDGRGVMTRDRMLAMAHIVTSTRDLQKQASAIRKQILTQGLAERMRVDPHNRRVQRAVTMWSAIAAGLYSGRQSMPAGYDPRRDDSLPERMIARLAETFVDVMGRAPATKPDRRGYEGRPDA